MAERASADHHAVTIFGPLSEIPAETDYELACLSPLLATIPKGEAAKTDPTSGQNLRLLTRELASFLGGTADGVGCSRAELAALLSDMAGGS